MGEDEGGGGQNRMNQKAMKNILFLAMILWIILPLMAFSQEIYQWVDEKGTVHFVDDPTLVPEKYRDQVQKKKVTTESSPSSSVPTVVPQAEKTRPEPQSSSVQRDRFGRGEEWWREKMMEWEDKLKNARTNYEKAHQAWKAKEKELEDSKFKPDSLKRKIKAEIKDLEEKTKAYEKEVSEARQMLEKVLPREAEENRADPDWLKPKEQKEAGESLPGPGAPPDSTINK